MNNFINMFRNSSSKEYCFYSKIDSSQEPIDRIKALGRLEAAKFFAMRKNLSLKSFLKIYSITKP